MRKSHRTSRAVFFVVMMPDQCRQLLAILRMKMYDSFPISRSRSPLDSRRQSGGGERSGKSSMRSDEKEGGDKDVRNRLGSKNGSRDERGDRENRTSDERAG